MPVIYTSPVFRCILFGLCFGFCFSAAIAEPLVPPDTEHLYGQFTVVNQSLSGFNSPYQGKNSLDPANKNATTADLTLFAGIRLGKGELWINPEIDQGFGLSNTVGVAGFPSGEAYKVGA